MSSSIESMSAINIFFCYAHEDEVLREELEKQLRILKRQGQILSWHDRKIIPGEEWEKKIDANLKAAHVILLLVSPDFMDSDYCYSIEMQRALEKHNAGDARVLPIILRPVYWEDAPFSKLHALPTDGIPVTKWSNRDEAFLDIAQGIRKVVYELRALYKTREGDAHYKDKHYEEALIAYQHAILLDSGFTAAYAGKGDALNGLKRYEEALIAYEQALHLNPDFAPVYAGKGNALNGLKRYQDALSALDYAIQLDPNFAPAYISKGDALDALRLYKKAMVAYEQALRLVPNDAGLYTKKGNILRRLKHYEEAVAAYEQAIQLASTLAIAYTYKGSTLMNLQRYKEALADYEQALHLAPNSVDASIGKRKVLEILQHKAKEQPQEREKEQSPKPIEELKSRDFVREIRKRPLKIQLFIILTGLTLIIVLGGSGSLLYYSFIGLKTTTSQNPARISNTTTSIAYASATSSIATATAFARAEAQNIDPYPPNPGTLVLSDPLNDNSGKYGWDINKLGYSGACQFLNGSYDVSQLQPQSTSTCVSAATSLSRLVSFVFEVQMKIVKGDCGGIILRNTSTSESIEFNVCQDGTYSLLENGGAVISNSSPAFITGLNKSNLIAYITDGINIDLYINNQEVNNCVSLCYPYFLGQIGVTAEANSDPTEVAYNNAKVWTLP
jgi:tetratricopeptide (TPR) repeat protein